MSVPFPNCWNCGKREWSKFVEIHMEDVAEATYLCGYCFRSLMKDAKKNGWQVKILANKNTKVKVVRK